MNTPIIGQRYRLKKDALWFKAGEVMEVDGIEEFFNAVFVKKNGQETRVFLDTFFDWFEPFTEKKEATCSKEFAEEFSKFLSALPVDQTRAAEYSHSPGYVYMPNISQTIISVPYISYIKAWVKAHTEKE